MDTTQSRRQFLTFFGRTTLTAAALTSVGKTFSIADTLELWDQADSGLPFTPLPPVRKDDVVLAKGFNYEVLAKFGDPLAEGVSFGTHNDYTAFVPFHKENPTDGLLWVNHEYTHPLFVSGYTGGEKTREQVETEMKSVGGSILRIRKEGAKWQIVTGDKHNKRIDALTEIPFAWPEPIAGSDKAMGTLANCAGGITPWGTVLTCEENYDGFYGETEYVNEERRKMYNGALDWEQYYDNPPEHYGWVVEVNPKEGTARKLVSLGRCAHECATLYRQPDGTCVVYTGDDANDECLYKFISARPDDLTEGRLYVADMENGRWISLQLEDQEVLRETFATQTDVLVRLREAARLVGGSRLARPEDIEIDPVTGAVIVALTNNKPRGNYHGTILRIDEGPDKTTLSFESSILLAGGPETGFACPDNLAFDLKGNLWFTSDISGSEIGKSPYEAFGNNSLFYVPMKGGQAGRVCRVASAPTDAEFTGPTFLPDGQTLMLCVQHPGERSPSLHRLTSHWPEGGDAVPKSGIILISGPALTSMMS
ncbi:PhoX family phosphatase [Roseivirga sp. BDSF3-8]|uniref:PhoX family protein n=1 Tax=Roseivirga sp. BDSF3-8 TaxID=3241598 RepID=UPI0035322BA1